MNYQKITNYLVVVLGVLGLGFLLLILVQGDDTIEMNALQGDFGGVSYIIYLAQLILAIAVLLSLGFSLKNLASDKQKMIGSLKAIGAFLVVLALAYLFSSGEETPMQDGVMLSASGARWVETGIRMFYFLTVIAVCSMGFGSVRKLIKK
ncbi:hypothetical protein N9S70_03660 [Flavobacteriaceae bacterium]|jgi:hypothetical protein|nr:hypothetical protein [bacterium]MDA9622846.1 hypothetical protein [Flavobacteriaceae bacterium]